MALSAGLCRKSGGGIGWFNGVHFVIQNGAQLFFFGALLPGAFPGTAPTALIGMIISDIAELSGIEEVRAGEDEYQGGRGGRQMQERPAVAGLSSDISDRRVGVL